MNVIDGERGVIFDVHDDMRNVIYSRVIIQNNIIFELPYNYDFEAETTSIKDKELCLTNDKNTIRINYDFYNEQDYKSKIYEIKEKYKITEDFVNYRGQRIIEYLNDTKICVASYDGHMALFLSSKCSRYSDEYFALYCIAFSFASNFLKNNKVDTYFKNSYCILKNGSHIYSKYNVNLIKHNPLNSLGIVNRDNFYNYIMNIDDFDYELDNFYKKEDNKYRNIVDRIKGYDASGEINDDPISMDLVEE